MKFSEAIQNEILLYFLLFNLTKIPLVGLKIVSGADNMVSSFSTDSTPNFLKKDDKSIFSSNIANFWPEKKIYLSKMKANFEICKVRVNCQDGGWKNIIFQKISSLQFFPKLMFCKKKKKKTLAKMNHFSLFKIEWEISILFEPDKF